MALMSAENLVRFKLNPTSPAVGIHLGTTNSCVGYFNNNDVEIVATIFGKRKVSSHVFYNENGVCMIGEQSYVGLKTSPNRILYDSKRMIGLNYDDNVVNRNKPFWTFTLAKSDNNRPVYVIDKNHQVLPEEVSSEILKELIKMAQGNSGKEKIKSAVITVPDHFLVGQKEATIHAATLAGIENVKLITESTAVAFAHGFDHKRFDGYNLFIFRLGGGTCDVTIIKIDNGEFIVIGHAGDTQLGGRDYDNCLMHYFDEKYPELRVNEIIKRGRMRLRKACENFKIAISESQFVTIDLDYVLPDLDLPEEDVTYKEYKEIVVHLTRRCRKLCLDALEETQLTADDIDEILLAGGSSKMRVIKDMLKEIFPTKELSEAINPDEVLAYGATLRAAQLLDPEKSKTFCNDRALSNGIGVSMVGNRYHYLIKRNTPIPTKFGPEIYSTVYNNQTVMNFYICQGERLSADKNYLIMDVELQGLPKKRAEKVKATLELELDGNGFLTAVARGGGKEVTKQVNFKEQITQNGANLCYAPSNISNIKLCASVDEKNFNLENFINRHYGHGIPAFQQIMNNIVLVNLNCRNVLFLINAFQTYYKFIYGNVNNEIPDWFANKSSLSDSISPTNWFTLSKLLGTNKILDKKNIAEPHNLTTFVTKSHNNFLITSVVDIFYFSAANSICSTINWIQNIKQVDAICLVLKVNGESNFEKTIIRHLSYFSNKDLERIVLFIIHKASNVIPIATITLCITDAVAEYYKERKAVFKNGYDNIFIFDNDAYKHLLNEPKSLQDMDECLLKTWYHTVFEFLRFLKRPDFKRKHFIIVEDL